jgi:uncharacterized membrane protein YedE/YeeE
VKPESGGAMRYERNDLVNHGTTHDLPGLPRASQLRIAIVAALIVSVLGLVIQHSSSTRQALLFAVGCALGIVLYRSFFGFTSAFRTLLADGHSAGFRAMIVMLGVACLLFFPVLAGGTIFGQYVTGFVSPVGVSVGVGAFLFGVGMQLGGGCASGTLFAIGGGSTRMVLTLFFFIVGSVIGVTHLAWWESLPTLAPLSIISALGWPAALALNMAVFAAAYVGVARIERSRHCSLAPITAAKNQSLLYGPWPLVAGAFGLAVLNFATLCLAGRPWGITSAFGLWGGMALQAAGVPVQPGLAFQPRRCKKPWRAVCCPTLRR